MTLPMFARLKYGKIFRKNVALFFQCVVPLLLCSCLPAVTLVEAGKQAASYAYKQATDKPDKFLVNQTDKQICWSATTLKNKWDISEPAKPFRREAERRGITEQCRGSFFNKLEEGH